MEKKIKEWKEWTQKELAKKELVQDQLNDISTKLKKAKIAHIQAQRAYELVKDTALKTQQQLEIHLSDMVSAGLNSVFDSIYKFVVKFELRRGTTECDLFFEKRDKLIDPLRFSGLGSADIAAFALRCACWSMEKKYSPILILDEPTKHLAHEHHERAGKLIKTLSDKLGLQIIMVTHAKDVATQADRIFRVKQSSKGFSKVKRIKIIHFLE